MSKSPDDIEIIPAWIAALAAVVVVLAALILGGMEAAIPDEDDCAARGKPADCWRASP